MESVDKALEVFYQFLVRIDKGDLEGRGIRIVGRLRAVDVVVGREGLVVAFFLAQGFEGDVGDDLIGIHVGRGAGSALDHIDGELIVEFSGDHTFAGGFDGFEEVFGQQAEVVVGPGGSQFDHSQGTHQLRIIAHLDPRNVEVFDGPLGLYSVIHGGVDFHFADRVALYSVFHCE